MNLLSDGVFVADTGSCCGRFTGNDWMCHKLQARLCGYIQTNIQAKIDARKDGSA